MREDKHIHQSEKQCSALGKWLEQVVIKMLEMQPNLRLFETFSPEIFSLSPDECGFTRLVNMLLGLWTRVEE